MGKAIIGILFVLFIICAVISLCSGCKSTAQHRATDSDIGYIRPESIETADYAIRERIGELERQIAGARATIREIRESGEAIGRLSRRSVDDVQGIIDKMEDLVLWVDWATGRIQYLENLLEDKVQN
jgi:hypothetical protein